MKVCIKDVCPKTGSNLCCFYCPEKDACSDSCPEHPDTCESCTKAKTDLTTFETQQMQVFRQIKGIVEQKKALEAQEKELKGALKKAMEANGIKSVDNDLLKITYVAPSTATTIDYAKLKKRYPSVAEECSKVSQKLAYIKIEVKDGE